MSSAVSRHFNEIQRVLDGNTKSTGRGIRIPEIFTDPLDGHKRFEEATRGRAEPRVQGSVTLSKATEVGNGNVSYTASFGASDQSRATLKNFHYPAMAGLLVLGCAPEDRDNDLIIGGGEIIVTVKQFNPKQQSVTLNINTPKDTSVSTERGKIVEKGPTNKASIERDSKNVRESKGVGDDNNRADHSVTISNKKGKKSIIAIGGNVLLALAGFENGKVRIATQAAREIPVHRRKVHESILREQQKKAAQQSKEDEPNSSHHNASETLENQLGTPAEGKPTAPLGAAIAERRKKAS